MGEPKGRVLVVDDDPSLVAFVTALLENEGYVVQTARNGEEALNQATESPPDLILLDLRMPVMDGWTCCRSLKQGWKTLKIPVILMSADREGAAVCADLGAEEFLRKPFEAADLLSCVGRYAGSAIS